MRRKLCILWIYLVEDGALMTDMRTREMKWEGSTVLIMIISLILALAKMNQRYSNRWNAFLVILILALAL